MPLETLHRAAPCRNLWVTFTLDSAMSRSERFEAEKGEWENLVGRALISFGEIELITHKWLSSFPRDAIARSGGRLAFTRRVDLILEILTGRELDSVGTEFAAALRRAKQLAETRNTIAHSPVMLSIYTNEAMDDILLEQSISSIRGDRVIDLAEMKEFAAEVGDLASRMWMLIMKQSDGNVRPV